MGSQIPNQGSHLHPLHCKDVRCKEILQDDGSMFSEPILDENGDCQYDYSLRYEEFIALNTAKIKQLEQRLNQAIDVIEKQQTIIEELQSKTL